MLTVNIREKDGGDRRLVFGTQDVVIGRAKGSDILLPKSNVSKRHARLTEKDDKVVLVDLRSTNGTYVNGRRITAAEEIGPDDKIYVGDFVLKVASVRNPEYESTAPHEAVPQTLAMDASPLDDEDIDVDGSGDEDDFSRTEDLDPALLEAVSDLEEPEDGLLDDVDEFSEEPSISPEDIFDEDISGPGPLSVDSEALGMDPEEAREVGLAPTRHSTGESPSEPEEQVDDAAQIVAATAAFDVLADPDTEDDEQVEPTEHLAADDAQETQDSEASPSEDEARGDDHEAPSATEAPDEDGEAEAEALLTDEGTSEDEAQGDDGDDTPEEEIVFLDDIDETETGTEEMSPAATDSPTQDSGASMTLAELLDDPTVDEIRLHGVAAAEITRAGCVERIAAPLENVDDLEDLIASLLDDAELDELGPVVIDTVLSDGRALTVVPVPLAPAGPLVRIQRRVSPSLTFDDLIERGAMTQEQLDALGAAVNRRDNVLVVGPNAIHRHGFCEALLGLLDERSGVISYGGPHRMKAQAGVVELDRTALGEAGEGLSDTARALGASMVITDTLSRDDLAEWVSIALDGQCGLIGAIAGRTGDSALARAALALDLAFGGSLGGQSSAMMTASVDIMVCLGEDSGGPTVTECGAP